MKQATMSDFSKLVPEHVRKLGGYTPGKSLRQAQKESRVTCIKMASNETPFGPSPRAVEAMQCGPHGNAISIPTTTPPNCARASQIATT